MMDKKYKEIKPTGKGRVGKLPKYIFVEAYSGRAGTPRIWNFKAGDDVPDLLKNYFLDTFPELIEKAGRTVMKSPKDKAIKAEDIKKKNENPQTIKPMTTDNFGVIKKGG